MTSSNQSPFKIEFPLSPCPSLDNADNIRVVAKVAYEWGWPLVNVSNRAKRMERVLRRFNEKHLRVEGWPIGYNSFTLQTKPSNSKQRLMCCPNTSLLYGGGAFVLGKKGAIAQVPPELSSSGNFWLYSLYDARSLQFGAIGKQYNSDAGFYLIVGPEWDGTNPDPARIPRSHIIDLPYTTNLVFLTARIFSDPEKKVPKWIQNVNFYPTLEYKPGVYQGVDWQKSVREIAYPGKPKEEITYVNWKSFFRKDFPIVLNQVKERPGEEEYYSCFKRLVKLASEKLWVMSLCRSVANEIENTTIQSGMLWSNNGKSAGNGWFTSVHSAEWPPEEYRYRTASAKSNLFQNRAEDTRYYFTDYDSKGMPLNGKHTYKITFEDGLPPAQGPASITVYSQYHFLCTKPYSISIAESDLGRRSSDPHVIYVGPAPTCDLRTPLNNPFCLYLRAYGMDETLATPWRPPLIERQ
jgi:hypothetical protein